MLRFIHNVDIDIKVDECEIFTVGVDDRWRTLPVPFVELHFEFERVTLNGIFNCFPTRECPDMISTFDIGQEKLGAPIAFPSGLVLDRRYMCLRVYDNQLGLVDWSSRSHITIWTMKKYAVADSWTQIVVLRSWFPRKMMPWLFFMPIAEMREGEIICSYTDGKYLISCDDKQERCSEFDLHLDVNSPGELKAYVPNFFCGAEKL